MRYRPEYDMQLIGRNLKRLREERKLTVDDVRKYLRLGSVQAIYKYESGRSYPPVDAMFALMQLYGAQLYDIVCECGGSIYIPMDVAEENRRQRFGKLCGFYKEYIHKRAG